MPSLSSPRTQFIRWLMLLVLMPFVKCWQSSSFLLSSSLQQRLHCRHGHRDTTLYSVKFKCKANNEDDESLKKESTYKPPVFSNSFKKHLEKVKGTFPDNDKEGIECTGEPAMDPSRMVMDDGIDSEYLSDF